MNKKILALISSLPVLGLLSCGFNNINRYENKYKQYYANVQIEKKYETKNTKYKEYLEYFNKKYYQKGLYPANTVAVKGLIINDLGEALNQKKNININSFTDEVDESIKNYQITMPKINVTKADLTNSAKTFGINQEYLDNVVKFINNYNKYPLSDVAGYFFFKGTKNNHKAVINAVGGPLNKAYDSNGYGIYRKLKSEYDVVSLNDSQYSFDPIKLYQKISKTKESLGYLTAIKKLLDIDLKTENLNVLKLFNFALSYIDTKRILFLEKYLKNTKNQDPYLYGLSQGYKTIQMAILMDNDVLNIAKKIRTENNSLRSWVGLFNNKKDEDYNIRNGGGVLTSSGAEVAIAGSKKSMSLLFALSKRIIPLTKSVMAIYQANFNKQNKAFKNQYQKKVRISFSKNDWNIGDITPKEIKFFDENNLNAQMTPEDGHGLNFPISDYVEWINN